ncbi:hypothetical protein [Sphingomonas sp. ID0503]|uniref:hypothetical protein n=1 Tax=Sphingomonas sp. ID0503 TaxID=3399691 RepID=UPI003AFB5EDF
MRRLAFAASAVLIASPAGAALDSSYWMDVQADVGVDTNPYLDEDSKTTGTASITLLPAVNFSGARSSTTVSGRYMREEYFSRYDASQDIGVNLDHSHRLSERLDAKFGAGFSHSTNALLNTDIDDDLATQGNQKRRSYDANGSLTYRISDRSTFTGTGYYQRAEYPGNEINSIGDYTTYGGTVGYSRVLNSRTSLGLSLGASETRSVTNPDSTSYQPQVTFEHRFSQAWTINGSVGVIFQKTKFLGRSENSTNLGAQLNLCGTYPRDSICIFGSRDSSASGYGGPRIRTSFGANYSRQLSERSRIAASGTYTRDKSQDFGFVARNVDYAYANASYERDVSQRLTAGVRANYSWRKFSGFSTVDSVGGSVFVRYRLGRVNR